MRVDIQEAANRARSLALVGVPKSLEHRAAMHATHKLRSRSRCSPRWQMLYLKRLQELREQQKILNLLPQLSF